MQKNIATVVIILVCIVALSVGLWFWSASSNRAKEVQEATPITSDIIFFYGKECSHCIETEKFLADNRISEKVKFDSLEVWYNKKNAAILQEKALECDLKKEEIGVPFLYSDGKCLIGSPDIEKFFQDKASGQ